MNILLVYATNSGGTLMASQTVTDILTQKGHTVILKEAAETTPDDVINAAFVLLASPSWDYENAEGMPHEHFVALMKGLEGLPAGKAGKTLENKPFAIVGLGDKSYTVFCGAVDHFETLVKNLKAKLVVPSLRIDGYFYDQTGNTQKITDWTNQLASSL